VFLFQNKCGFPGDDAKPPAGVKNRRPLGSQLWCTIDGTKVLSERVHDPVFTLPLVTVGNALSEVSFNQVASVEDGRVSNRHRYQWREMLPFRGGLQLFAAVPSAINQLNNGLP
jgi:hypothetical protein